MFKLSQPSKFSAFKNNVRIYWGMLVAGIVLIVGSGWATYASIGVFPFNLGVTEVLLMTAALGALAISGVSIIWFRIKRLMPITGEGYSDSELSGRLWGFGVNSIATALLEFLGLECYFDPEAVMAWWAYFTSWNWVNFILPTPNQVYHTLVTSVIVIGMVVVVAVLVVWAFKGRLPRPKVRVLSTPPLPVS